MAARVGAAWGAYGDGRRCLLLAQATRCCCSGIIAHATPEPVYTPLSLPPPLLLPSPHPRSFLLPPPPSLCRRHWTAVRVLGPLADAVPPAEQGAAAAQPCHAAAKPAGAAEGCCRRCRGRGRARRPRCQQQHSSGGGWWFCRCRRPRRGGARAVGRGSCRDGALGRRGGGASTCAAAAATQRGRVCHGARPRKVGWGLVVKELGRGVRTWGFCGLRCWGCACLGLCCGWMGVRHCVEGGAGKVAPLVESWVGWVGVRP